MEKSHPQQNSPEEKCCEKCLKCPDYSEHDYCHDKSCSCHQVKEEEVNKYCDKCGWELKEEGKLYQEIFPYKEVSKANSQEVKLEILEWADHLFTNNSPEQVQKIIQKYIRIISKGLTK